MKYLIILTCVAASPIMANSWIYQKVYVTPDILNMVPVQTILLNYDNLSLCTAICSDRLKFYSKYICILIFDDNFDL